MSGGMGGRWEVGGINNNKLRGCGRRKTRNKIKVN